MIVRVSITANVSMPDALFTDLLPAGLEIENFNLGDAKQWADVVVDGINITDRSSSADVKHEEYRDDRYVAALKLDRGDAAKVFYLVRAVTPGTYTRAAAAGRRHVPPGYPRRGQVDACLDHGGAAVIDASPRITDRRHPGASRDPS